MTLVGKSNLLSIQMDLIFKYLRKNKVLMLSTQKKNAFKDCITTSPPIISAALNKNSLVDSFAVSCMIVSTCKRCSDVYALINSFKINLSKVNGGKQWLIDVLPIVLNEMFENGEVN